MEKYDLLPLISKYFDGDTPVKEIHDFIDNHWNALRHFNVNTAKIFFDDLYEKVNIHFENKNGFSNAVLLAHDGSPKKDLFFLLGEEFFDFAIVTIRHNKNIMKHVGYDLVNILTECEKIINNNFSKKSEIKVCLKNIDNEIKENEQSITGRSNNKEKEISFAKRKKLNKLKDNIISHILENVMNTPIALGLSHCYTKRDHLIWLNETNDKFTNDKALCSSKIDSCNHTHSKVEQITCKACLNKLISLYKV